MGMTEGTQLIVFQHASITHSGWLQWEGGVILGTRENLMDWLSSRGSCFVLPYNGCWYMTLSYDDVHAAWILHNLAPQLLKVSPGNVSALPFQTPWREDVKMVEWSKAPDSNSLEGASFCSDFIRILSLVQSALVRAVNLPAWDYLVSQAAGGRKGSVRPQ